MYTKLFKKHRHIVSICWRMALIFVTLFQCSLWQPSYIPHAVRLQMRLNKRALTVFEYEMILIDCTVYQGTLY
jgi:hypothetical protein